jgi:hypothetical protein
MRWAFVSFTSAIDTFPQNPSRIENYDPGTKKPGVSLVADTRVSEDADSLKALGRNRAAA